MNETQRGKIKVSVSMPDGKEFKLEFEEGTSTKEIYGTLSEAVFCFVEGMKNRSMNSLTI